MAAVVRFKRITRHIPSDLVRIVRNPQELAPLPGNDTCADCPSRNPDWASINLGVLLCLRCSGLHRQLGTHITKVCLLLRCEHALDTL